MVKFLLSFTLLFAGGLYTLSAAAHEIRPAIIQIVFERDASVKLTIEANFEVFLSGMDNEIENTDFAPEKAVYESLRSMPASEFAEELKLFADEFSESLQLTVAGEPLSWSLDSVEVPEAPDLRLSRISKMYFTAQLPVAAQQVQWLLEERYGESVVSFRLSESDQKTSYWLKSGESSPIYTLDGQYVPRARLEIAYDYTVLGFLHILPKGVDHILFVLGLFLLSRHFKPLLWQVTAFTLAHSITLALSIYGVISVPASIVEPLIALSIAYVGIENLLTRSLHSWRIVVVFVFGLLHGMGFAGVLTELGLPQSEFVTALVTFNIGVELGQLSVISLAFVAVFWARGQATLYRNFFVIPGSLIIAGMGVYWTLERTGLLG